MSERHRIRRISETQPAEREGNAIVMVGSFAPIHKGHLDAVRAATKALTEKGVRVETTVLTPNSTEYLGNKLPDEHDTWPYERRVRTILEQEHGLDTATYVDDVSAYEARDAQINDHVPVTIKRHLGFRAYQLFLIVGSDQLLSMESHLSNEQNRAVCVLRPGSTDGIQERLRIPWVAKALALDQLIVTERDDMENDISSTEIRRSSVLVE